MPPSDRWKAFALVALSPFLAELVSGSTPPQIWILPPVFLVFMAIYGLSALVARDLAIRCGGGATTVLLLGLAFGIVNEGMAAHSLFNPAWPGLDVLGSYGRWEGVNWLWAAWVVPFHAVWSISFPVFLVGQVWPESRDRRWIGDRRLLYLIPVPIVVAALGSFLIAGYSLTAGDWLGMLLVVLLLGWVALRWGPRFHRLRPLDGWKPSPRTAFALGFLFFVMGQIGTWQTPRLGPYPEVGLALLLAGYAAFAAVALGLDRTAAGDRSRFAFVLGGIAFYVALSPLAEFVLGRIGLVAIDLVVFYLVARLYLARTRAALVTAAPAHVLGELPDAP